MAAFELYWRNISGSAVALLWVVEHLDAVEDIGLGGIVRGIRHGRAAVHDGRTRTMVAERMFFELNRPIFFRW